MDRDYAQYIDLGSLSFRPFDKGNITIQKKRVEIIQLIGSGKAVPVRSEIEKIYLR